MWTYGWPWRWRKDGSKKNLKAWQLSHHYEKGCPKCSLTLKIKNKVPAILLLLGGLFLTWLSYDWLFDRNIFIRDGVASLIILATFICSLLLLRIEFAKDSD